MLKVETAAFVASNVPAWQGVGTVLDVDGKAGLTVDEALTASGLDWEVKRIPIFGKWEGKNEPIPGRYGVQRQTDGKIFGTVGGAWVPVQNRTGFAVLQALLEQAGGEVWIESAGSLDGGKKVWILARCAESLQIAGESYHSHIGFVNGHDGRTSVTAFMSDMRTACSNFLTYIMNGQAKLERILRVRHSTNVVARIQEAHHLLGLRHALNDELAKQAEWMVDQPMSDGAFEVFLESLMPLPDEATTTAGNPTPAATMITQRRDKIVDIYANAPNLATIRGTRWGALQAVTEYADHGRATKNESAVCKTQFGLAPSPLKQGAYHLLAKRA